jgi:hypothetical protein
VPQPLTVAAQIVVTAGRQAVGVGDERRERLEALARPGGVPRQLVVRPAGGLQLAPRATRLGDRVAGAREAVERRELVPRPGETALLELSARREQRLGRGGDVLTGGAPPPRVGPCPAVGEDPAREHERVLALGAELGELAENVVFGQVELGFHVRLAGGGADRRRVALRAEQEPDRPRQDRLAGARLARDRIQARVEHELGVPDQDEILDPEPAQHGSIVRRPSDRAYRPLWPGPNTWP